MEYIDVHNPIQIFVVDKIQAVNFDLIKVSFDIK